jgi:hypothetical protein
MEESFLLSFYGKYSIFEQSCMTAEERAWLIERINKAQKEKYSDT